MTPYPDFLSWAVVVLSPHPCEKGIYLLFCCHPFRCQQAGGQAWEEAGIGAPLAAAHE